jgi:hypothetical protein
MPARDPPGGTQGADRGTAPGCHRAAATLSCPRRPSATGAAPPCGPRWPGLDAGTGPRDHRQRPPRPNRSLDTSLPRGPGRDGAPRWQPEGLTATAGPPGAAPQLQADRRPARGQGPRSRAPLPSQAGLARARPRQHRRPGVDPQLGPRRDPARSHAPGGRLPLAPPGSRPLARPRPGPLPRARRPRSRRGAVGPGLRLALGSAARRRRPDLAGWS